jgi:hypothetical protein
LYASQFSGQCLYHLIEHRFFMAQKILISQSYPEAQIAIAHLLKSPTEPIHRTDEPVEDKEEMDCNYADKSYDSGPNSCVQSEHLISGTRPDFQTQAFILELDNVGHKKKNSQKDDNDSTVDEDHGQEFILE